MSKSLKFVFLISTEHQLFQVKTAIAHFKLNIEKVVLLILAIDNDNFAKKMTGNKQYGEVIVFQNWVFKDLFLNRSKCKLFIAFCEDLKRNNKVDIFFTSHYDSDPDLLFLSIVNPPQYYLMDEGTASFSVVNSRNKLVYRKKIEIFIKSILYNKAFSLPQKITYFTQYNLNKKEQDVLEKYQVDKIDNPLIKLLESESIFIGTSIVELNMIKESDYLVLLQKVYDNIKQTKCYYYPHRKESITKLRLIEQMGFIIKKIDEPFETMFAKQQEFPALCCSFFTTGVLYNIAKSNEKIPELKVYKFDVTLLLLHSKVYEQIYTEMQTSYSLKFIKI
jgi:hypothetical protein